MGENITNQQRAIRGIKIRTFSIVMMILACITFVTLISSTFQVSVKYDTFVTQTEEYIACEGDALMLQEASDYLTEQVRLYVHNTDDRYMENYFTEIHETRRREQALESLKKHNQDDSVERELEAALESSNGLMHREIYAMKLAAEASGCDEQELPQEVRDMKLYEEDLLLTPDEKLEKARHMVFDPVYQTQKGSISGHLDRFSDSVMEELKDRQQNNERDLRLAYSYQRFFIAVLFILNVLTYAVITVLVVRPLHMFIKSIQKNETLEIVGSHEFQYLALTYNDIYEIRAQNEAKLAHKAEHDALTGILNRGAFDELKEILNDRTEPMTLVLVDVDHFKEINDSYGHETGDKILKKVATALSSSFRSEDFVVRIGGDEFVVVSIGVSKREIGALEKKFIKINRTLQYPEDGLPPVSLSIGAACSESGFHERLYKQADMALYKVKAHGRCGFSYFQS